MSALAVHRVASFTKNLWAGVSKSGARKTVALTFLVGSVNVAGGLAIGVITARVMPVHERGALIAGILWIAVVGMLAVFGTDQAIIALAKGSESRAQELRLGSRRVVLLLTLIGCLVISPILAFAVVRMDLSGAVLVSGYSWIAVASNSYSTRRLAVVRSSERYSAWNAVRLVPTTSIAIGFALLAAANLLTFSSGLGMVALGNLGAAVASWRLPVAKARDQSAGPDFYHFSSRVVLTGIPALANQRLDQLLISLFLSAGALSIYAASVSMTVLAVLAGVTMELYLLPALSALSGVRRHQTYRRWLRFTLLAVVPLATGLAFAAGPLLRLVFGDPYAVGERPAQILLVGSVALAGTGVTTAYLKASNQVSRAMKAQLLGLGTTLILLPVGLAVLGITGAAVVSSISYWIAFLYSLRTSQRRRAGTPMDIQEDITKRLGS